MADSVSLVRRKIADPASALQDETLDSIITLAAIEYGKGNTDVSTLHFDGIKRLVQLRGGIDKVKRLSPLTARMVAWYVPIHLSVLDGILTDTLKDIHDRHASTAVPNPRRLWIR